MQFLSCALVAAIAIGAGTTTVAGQAAQLRRITSNLLHAGYLEAGFWHEGALAHRQSVDNPVLLTRGVAYVFNGTCDVDCSDLDLRLRNGTGAVVAEDVSGDDVPQFAFTPRRSGIYQLEVRMCAIEPCGYSL